jgi:hypothetical protein
MPVTDGFGGGIVRIDGNELSERDGYGSTLPPGHDEHVAGAGSVRCDSQNLNKFAFSGRRNSADR